MTFSPTANMLAKAIKSSGLPYRAIADHLGYRNASIVSEMATGAIQVPAEDIPAMARTLGLDPDDFLLLALEEYHPEVFIVLSEVLGMSISMIQRGLILMYRMADISGNPELEPAFSKAIEGLLAIGGLAIPRHK